MYFYVFMCVYERVVLDGQRTNNVAEAAHRRMQRELCMEHPSLWRFIDALRSVQKNRDKLYEEFVRGDPATPKRRKYCEADERIRNIVRGGFGPGTQKTALEYLRGLAHNFDMDL